MHIDVVVDGSFFRAYLDGVDVSTSCFAADSDEGWVDVYVDSAGTLAAWSKFELDEDGEMLSARRYGHVVIEPIPYPPHAQ